MKVALIQCLEMFLEMRPFHTGRIEIRSSWELKSTSRTLIEASAQAKWVQLSRQNLAASSVLMWELLSRALRQEKDVIRQADESKAYSGVLEVGGDL